MPRRRQEIRDRLPPCVRGDPLRLRHDGHRPVVHGRDPGARSPGGKRVRRTPGRTDRDHPCGQEGALVPASDRREAGMVLADRRDPAPARWLGERTSFPGRRRGGRPRTAHPPFSRGGFTTWCCR
ncbi:hypothetical protein GCM10019016_088250 [Streptomyces prasinosporus]|uniref:Uncharacterized protein n=1 Tax=Streptomyces prasinosporus TaxID=68256 RepID=A0ABP6U4V2_9ACTN